MKADGTDPTRLTNNLSIDNDPTWSPNGRQIAFMSNRLQAWEIYIMNADGTGPTAFTNSPDIEGSPSWSR